MRTKTWKELLQEIEKMIRTEKMLMQLEMSCIAISTIAALLNVTAEGQWISAAYYLICGSIAIYLYSGSTERLNAMYRDRGRIEFYGELQGWDK